MLNELFHTNLTLGDVAAACGVELPAGLDGDAPCGRVLTQAVYVKPGDVVISAGWYYDREIIPPALQKGAAMVICSAKAAKRFPDPRVAVSDDPQEAVRRFQRWRAEGCHAKRIAITGSVGKTTTTGLINSVLTKCYPTLTHHTMANSHGAILRNVQRLRPTHKYWVQEVGGVQPGYIESSAQFLCPDAVVLTNIGESHLNLYKTKEGIFHDKASLERYAQPDAVVIINSDDEMLRNGQYTHKVITCSYSDPAADYHAENVHTDLDGVVFTVVCKDGEKCEIRLHIYGEHNVYNALSAVAVCRWAGVPLEKIARLMADYRPDGMRQNMIHVGGYNLLVDTFNAEPKTVLLSAQTLEKLPVPQGGRRIFATGHIDKLGDHSPEMHARLGHDIAKLNLDQVLFYAGDSRYAYEAMVSDGCTNALMFTDRDKLDDWLRQNVKREDVVFFKSGQFEAALAKTVDHVFGTSFQNEQQFNNGEKVVTPDGFHLRLRKDGIAELEGYDGDAAEVVIPETYGQHTVIRIAPEAFKRNKTMTSVVIPDTVVSIGREAFYSCSALTDLHLPAGLKIVDKNAFNYCRSLKTLTIPEGAIHLDRHAFYDCKALEDVTIPASVGFIGEEAFGTTAQRSHKVRFHCVPGSATTDAAAHLPPPPSLAQRVTRKLTHEIKHLLKK